MNATLLPPRPHLIKGTRLSLRDLCAEDANDTYARWMNDPDVTCYTESRDRHHTHESLLNYIQIMSDSPYNLFLNITGYSRTVNPSLFALYNIGPIFFSFDLRDSRSRIFSIIYYFYF